MASWPALPVELWRYITGSLFREELFAFSLSCRRLRDICASHLQRQIDLSNEYRVFDANKQSFSCHELLAKILLSEISPMYIQELRINYCYLDLDTDRPERRGWDRWRLYANLFDTPGQAQELTTAAIKASPWIDDQEEATYLERIYRGNEDSVLCLLVPLLSNLRCLSIPTRSFTIFDIIERIARAYFTDAAQGRNSTLPLSKLLLARTYDIKSDGSAHLDDLACIAALPSVRRIIFSRLHEDDFYGWPEGILESRVSEVYFDISTVDAKAVTNFAKGIALPCIMRQLYCREPNLAYDFEWDHYTISGEIDPLTNSIVGGTRHEVIETRYSENDHVDVFTDHGTRVMSPAMCAQGVDELCQWQDLLVLE